MAKQPVAVKTAKLIQSFINIEALQRGVLEIKNKGFHFRRQLGGK
ncbi:hypothetical protein HNQ56_003059 [Anaerotaenia torta]